MINPIDGALVYNVSNVVIFTKQGTSFIAGGSFLTIPGQPSQQLLPSTNKVLGYFNGQMLATANGDGKDDYAGLTAGALVNFDPNSSDTGQKEWNTFIICDGGLTQPLPIGATYSGTVQVATAHQGWVIRQQYLYASGTPETDAVAVNTAVSNTVGTIQSAITNSSNTTEIVFTY